VAEVPAQDGFDDRIWSRLDLVGGRDPGIERDDEQILGCEQLRG
jgi:hypothetical protein